MAIAPYLNSGRSNKTSSPGVRQPKSRAAAILAIGVMDRALATAPINAENFSPRNFIFDLGGGIKTFFSAVISPLSDETRDLL